MKSIIKITGKVLMTLTVLFVYTSIARMMADIVTNNGIKSLALTPVFLFIAFLIYVSGYLVFKEIKS
jgi:CBS domain containing-hemolysin-like protein